MQLELILLTQLGPSLIPKRFNPFPMCGKDRMGVQMLAR